MCLRRQSVLAEHADVLALCGDLTDRGDPEEARLMAKALGASPVPIGSPTVGSRWGGIVRSPTNS